MGICSYGCNRESLFTFKNGRNCCSSSANACPAKRQKDSDKKVNKLAWNKGLRYKTNKPAWNRGLTKDTNASLKITSEKNKNKVSTFLGKVHSKETKKIMSDKMKKRHKEGIAWNIGKSRWNNKPSYPESFFMKVVENEFEDKNYTREYPFSKYSLDFAWVDKKKVIEIDGEQHERFEDYKRRDLEKDVLLIESGWSVLRVKWKDMFSHSKEWIQICKNFIDN